MTESGYIKRQGLREKVQVGFERLGLEDVQREGEGVKGLLGEWDVVALRTGTVRGWGFQKTVCNELYGPEVEEMMVIKRVSKDPILNWINWMQ